MVRSLLVLGLSLLIASAVSGQSIPLSPGETVRLRSELASGRFYVVAITADVLTVRDTAGGLAEVQWATIDRLAVNRGRRSSGRAFLRGLGIGSLVGAGTGIMIGLVSGDDPPGGFIRFTAAEKAMLAGTVLGAGGGIAGGLIGLAVPGERWEKVSLTGPGAAASAGLVGVRYSYRF